MSFGSILSNITGTLTVSEAIICTLVSLVLGFIIAAAYMASGEYTKNFAMTLVLLPALVQLVIMMVNGNLGTSVAVLGTFSLVRFRSAPGSSREISSIFFTMAVGLATGMGFLGFAVMITVLLSAVFLILSKTAFGEGRRGKRILKITIPENLEYEGVFQDIFETYTVRHDLERVKTTNLGSMFELSYQVQMKKNIGEKEMIDAIRCRNGNLTVLLSRQLLGAEEQL